MIRSSLLTIVLMGFFTGFLIVDSAKESIFWEVSGTAGLIGVAAWGISSKEVVQIIKSKLS